MAQHDPDDPRQKGHRQLVELLQELRVALPGVQVLFGFLLVVPFSARWGEVTAFQRDLYFACLLCSAAATAFLIAPSAIHRLGYTVGIAGVFVVVWYTIPLYLRAKGGDDAA